MKIKLLTEKWMYFLFVSMVLVSCAGDDDTNMDPRSEDFTLELVNTQLSSSSNSYEVFNGELIYYDIESTRGDFGNQSLLEIKNISNDRVSVQMDDNGIRFMTNEVTDQRLSFDAFYQGIKINSVQILVKVPFKLIKNDQELSGAVELNINSMNTLEEYKLIHQDGSDINEFALNGFLFVDNENNAFNNYKIYDGENFKIAFDIQQIQTRELTLSLFYIAEKYDNKQIFVKGFNIKLDTESDSDCEKVIMNLTSRTVNGDSNRLNNSYTIKNGNLTRYSDIDGKYEIYYEGGKISEIYNSDKGYIKAKYEYHDEKLSRAEEYIRNSAVQVYDYFYDNDGNLSSVSKTKLVLESGFISQKDSIVYGEYVHNLPQRRVEYNDITNEESKRVLYFKLEYDDFGNSNKEEISTDDEEYILFRETSYDQNEKWPMKFDWKTGSLSSQPLALFKGQYSNYKGEAISPAFENLKNIEKNEEGEIVSIEIEYNASNFSQLNIYSYNYESCN